MNTKERESAFYQATKEEAKLKAFGLFILTSVYEKEGIFASRREVFNNAALLNVDIFLIDFGIKQLLESEIIRYNQPLHRYELEEKAGETTHYVFPTKKSGPDDGDSL